MNKYLIGALVVVLAGIAWLGVTFPQSKTVIQSLGSAAGSTLGTAKFAGVVMIPSTNTATGTSLYNGDGSARYITGVVAACDTIGTSLTPYTGAGLAAWKLTMGTTSVAYGTGASSNFGLGSTTAPIAPAVTFATATPENIIASSTPAIATSSIAMVWPTGSYLTIGWNATNTAVCTVGVNYVGN